MKRMLTIAAIAACAATLTITGANAQDYKANDHRTKELRPAPNRPNLVPVPVERSGNLRVRVWTDIGDGGRVVPGESVDIFFRVNRSAYVAIYDVDTRGRVTRLFPRSPYDDGYVRGGRTVALPGPYADYRLVATGPAGVERIVAIASEDPILDRGGRFRGGSLHGRLELDGYLRLDGTSDWSDGAVDLSVALTPASGRVELRPDLVPVPVDRCGTARDETWFRVRPGRWSRW